MIRCDIDICMLFALLIGLYDMLALLKETNTESWEACNAKNFASYSIHLFYQRIKKGQNYLELLD